MGRPELAGRISGIIPKLNPNLTEGAVVREREPGAWHLEIPAGPPGRYRLAQIDDYDSLPRRAFPWRPPLRLKLRARASTREIPGTWGFGLWNNPFSMALVRGVEMVRLPALPNAAWFFFASPPNYLSLRDDLPAQGCLAATFRSPRWPGLMSLLGIPAAPLLALRPAVRLMRRAASRIVRQAGLDLGLDATRWHTYELVWKTGRVVFTLDGEKRLETPVSPRGPLGLVMWVDNQYAALPPDGRIGFGTLENPEPVWIDIEEIEVFVGD